MISTISSVAGWLLVLAGVGATVKLMHRIRL